MSSKYYLSIKICKDIYKHFPVEPEVYYYVKQLESYINYPEFSKLREIYPTRFHGDNWPHGKKDS